MTADNGQVYVFTMALAAGEIDEAGAAAFFRDHVAGGEHRGLKHRFDP